MFGVFLDISNRRIISGKTLQIEVIEELANNIVNHRTYKGLSKSEVKDKVAELQMTYEEFQVISVDTKYVH